MMFAWPPPHLGLSMLELAVSVLALVFFTLRYSHVRLAQAKLGLLDQLREEGLLSGDARKDYRTLTRLIHTMSPAVTLRTEFWVGFYWLAMRALAAVALEKWANCELRRLTAHQARRYQIAIERLEALRFEA